MSTQKKLLCIDDEENGLKLRKLLRARRASSPYGSRWPEKRQPNASIAGNFFSPALSARFLGPALHSMEMCESVCKVSTHGSRCVALVGSATIRCR